MLPDQDALVNQLLHQNRPETPATIGAWFRDFKQDVPGHYSSVLRAMLGGRRARCVGHAFASGYQSALEHLFAAQFDPNQPALASLCVTEQNGNHPKAIEASLSEENGSWILSGQKSFVSGATEAQQLFIACQSGLDETGRPKIKVVSLPSSTAGIRIETLPDLPFVPEVSHGRVLLDRVLVEGASVLAGDGYEDFVKPFRSCEDVHVMSAIAAYMLGQSLEAKASLSLSEDLLSLALSFLHLDISHLDSAQFHLLLAGLRNSLHRILPIFELELSALNPAGAAHWKRDAALLKVAEKAHVARTKKAWETLSSLPG